MFVVKYHDSMVEKSYSFCADPKNIGISSPQNLRGRDINLLSMSEQFISLAIAGNYCNLKFGRGFLKFDKVSKQARFCASRNISTIPAKQIHINCHK